MKKCITCNIEKSLNEFHISKKEKDGFQHQCKECKKEYYQNNLIHYKEKHKEYRDNNSNYINEWFRNRKKNDPLFKLKCNVRDNIGQSFKRACKGVFRKNSKTQEILGCTLDEFINHLQSQFTEGMTLENYGIWEIDHIIPISSAKTENEIIKLNHYTNLQPLWKSDNRKKSNKII